MVISCAHNAHERDSLEPEEVSTEAVNKAPNDVEEMITTMITSKRKAKRGMSKTL